jgi:Zn-dependent metalloprotease
MAFINSGDITGEMEIKVPLDVITAVLDAFNKNAFKLELSESSLYVSNALVNVVLSLPQKEEQELQIEEVIEAAKLAKTSKGQEIEVSKAQLVSFLENAQAVATKERSEVRLSTETGKLKLEVITANGSAKGAIKANTNVKASALIDFEFLDEAVRKSGESVVMKLVKNEFIAFKLKEGTVIVSLNQEA